ncbi:hypothetical protein Cgig2_011663 [Carnegiea gigantea]|uniref:FHA domain-containing protein n=1 Tax=Carnegiea gigantea TaxID=171969 RepID=A0A9Q1GL11_9CARY|nr:hypothetical protein Cgig2_011663 [Carnegiea gigantea]
MASTASPILKLVIEKGPRNGETIEFNSKSTVRIDRVVRGNNLPITDAGISSKHLAIEFNSDSSKWVITDLESSNGTLLNNSQLKPLSSFELRNADEIKIGELTSIRVESGGEICHRRDPRRQAALKRGLALGSKAEECPNLEEGGSVRVRDLKWEDVQRAIDSGVTLGKQNRKGRTRGRAMEENVLGNGNAEDVGNVEVDVNVRGVGTRMTRNSKREGYEFLNLVEPVRAKRTRSEKKAEKVPENEAVDVGNCKEVENASLVEGKKTRGHWRKKKKLDVECLDNPKDAILEDMTTRETTQLEVPDVGEPTKEPMVDTVRQHVLGGVTTVEASQVEVQDTVSADKMTEKVSELEVEQVGGIVDVKGQPGQQRIEDAARENDNAVRARDWSDKVLEDERAEETEMGEVSEERDADAYVRYEDQEAGDVPDLEKMTLGEWFDYLEVCLSKQILTVTDEIILDMQKRAKQFDEFMLQQQNEEGKLPIST